MLFLRFIGTFLGILVATTAYSAGSPIDQYKQMGSAAALAESCYNSKKIPESLNQSIKEAVAKNPSIEELMNTLIAAYNEAYEYAILHNQIWNGTQQSYSKPFTCSVPEDSKFIMNVEASIIESLNNKKGVE
ncbi:MAG: hypothetical protein ACWGKN_08585 [Desulfoprunum sp.]|jgi:hypothetical protein